jgi:Fe-S-cluster containining protein
MGKHIPENKKDALAFLKEKFQRTPYFDYSYTAAYKLKPIKLAAYLIRLFENTKSSWVKPKGKSPDCRRGCSLCCHMRVEANKAEALYLVRHVKKNLTKTEIKDLKARAVERDALTRDKKTGWWVGKKIPCLLLDTKTGDCTVYESRPMSCRRLYSYSLAKCKTGYEGTTNDNAWWAHPYMISEDINAGVAYAMIEKDDFEEFTIEEALAKFL